MSTEESKNGDDSSLSKSPEKVMNLPWPQGGNLLRRFVRGPNGELWAFAALDDDSAIYKVGSAETLREFEDRAVRAIAVSSDEKRIAVGFDDGSLDIYTDGSLKTCFAAPIRQGLIRDLKFHPRYPYWLAIASEEVTELINVETEETVKAESVLKDEVSEAHKSSGTRSVAFHAQADEKVIMSTLSLDGRLCYWDVSGKPEEWGLLHCETSFCITKKDPSELLGADPWDRACRGSHVILAKFTVSVLPGEPFLQLRRLNGSSVENCNSTVQEHSESIVIAFARGHQVVTSGRDGTMLLWNLQLDENEKPMVTLEKKLAQFESPPTDFLWEENELYVALANGGLKVLSLPFSKARKERKASPVESTSKGLVENRTDKTDDFAGDDDDVDFTHRATKNPFIDDEAADDEDSVPNPATNGNLDDESDVSPPKMRDYDNEYDDADDMDDGDYPLQQAPVVFGAKIPKPQAPFGPSATPIDLPHRFLCWNHIGTAVWHRGEDGIRDSIDITPTDSAFSRPVRFTDTVGFILGSLGEDGGIFCTDVVHLDDDDDPDNQDVAEVVAGFRMDVTKATLKKMKTGAGSTIYFHRFESLGSNRDKDWYLTLPDGERAVGCATGEGWAAVITSRRFLRMFSSGGNQGAVVWLDGEPVTMSGRGRFVAVFYHRCAPLPDGSQKLDYLVYDAVSNRTVARGPASCLCPGASLSWVGFMNDLSLLAFDSSGMLSMLASRCGDAPSHTGSWEWVPVLDTVGLRKSSDDSHWPITAIDGKLVCVPLKGGVRFPDATRRPVTAAVGFRLPLAKGDLSTANVLEELSIRADYSLCQKKVMNEISSAEANFEEEYVALSAQVDKVVLKLFAGIVQSGKIDRALDLVDRLHLEKSYELAMKLSAGHHKLMDLIEDAKDHKFGQTYGDDFAESPEYITRNGDFESQRKITPDARPAKRAIVNDSTDGSRQVRSRQVY